MKARCVACCGQRSQCAPSVYQVPTHMRRETTNNHAVTARVTQRKYYSSDNDFLSARKPATAGQLCHLLQVQYVSHSSQRQIHTQSCLVCYSGRCCFGSVYPQPVLYTPGQPSELIQGHWHDEFFFKEEEQSQMGRKGD